MRGNRRMEKSHGKPGGGDGSEKSRIHADTARSMSEAYEVALYQSRQPPRTTPSELT